jgi:hypothetical protein
LSLARCPGDDDLQPIQPVVEAAHLAAHVREDGSVRTCARGTRHRLQSRQGTPLGRRIKKGEYAEAIGRSRGGRTSKIRALADDLGRPVAFALTLGNIADISMAIPLLETVVRPKRLLVTRQALPARPTANPTAPKRHRAHVLQAQKLAPDRNKIRSP